MKRWAGVIDFDWYTFLSERGFDEVNFWQLSGSHNLSFHAPILTGS